MREGSIGAVALVLGTLLVGAAVSCAMGARASAQDSRRVELRFTPTARAQVALWIESADGALFQTVRLTDGVAVRGIGNRPGATQMNSGWRWPYGRREGALPVWAHRRLAAGQPAFARVIFNGRVSEGNASSAGSVGEPRNTRDDYFCLSFNRALSERDALDAVSCASVFMSNKGRYMTSADLESGYAEPWEGADRNGRMRPMTLSSPYPPRRDVVACDGLNCGDAADVGTFALDARAAMPEIDAVTMATPAGDRAQRIVFDVPEAWPDGDYVAYVEINVEGDWNETYNGSTNPTPQNPSGAWDYWAMNYGYAYRGQPSVVYGVPFQVRSSGGEWSTADVLGYGALHGEDGTLRDMDGSITDEPSSTPGSGADRLRAGDGGDRLTVVVPAWDVCEQPNPPEMCGWECTPEDDRCGAELICGPDMTCVGVCDVPMNPGSVVGLALSNHADIKEAHHWARLRFEVPVSPRALLRYDVRVGTSPITDLGSFERALPAVEPSIEREELTVPVDGVAGDEIDLAFGGLTPETRYYVAVRAVDECNDPGPIAVGEIETTAIHFTTVSPCFVATAAYGSALAPRIAALRRFRDRHLRTNAPGRAAVAAYHAIGPRLAGAIRGDDTRRAVARALLAPIVALAEWLE